MDINKLLVRKECECGMTHDCEIKEVIIRPGAVNEIVRVTAGYSSILLVADKNTYAVCGKRVSELLGDKLENSFIFDCNGFVIPNEDAIEKIKNAMSEKTDLIVGVGSGVIQDLCKYVSFTSGLKYHIIATAPSMDGYASKGAAMIIGNMKVTYNAHVPEVIIGDTDILKNAPIDMIKSGYGDILGKFSCLNDWKLSHIVNNEYICSYVYNLTYEMLSSVKDLGKKLLERNEDAITTLMEALVGVGVAMAYVGNSRPASGSEHHLSHFFEVVGILNNEDYFMHGIDVVYSAIYTEKIREKLLELDKIEKREHNPEKWQNDIKRIYSDAADGVIGLQEKLGWYELDKTEIYKEKWHDICDVLKEAPTSSEMLEYLRTIELDINEFNNTYGAEKINNALLYAKDLKDRYSVLWLYYALDVR